LRLLSSNKFNRFNALIHFGGDKRAHRAFALSAIKITPIFCKNITWTARTGIDSLTRTFFVNIIADANDHESHLQHLRMIVKNNANDLQTRVD